MEKKPAKKNEERVDDGLISSHFIKKPVIIFNNCYTSQSHSISDIIGNILMPIDFIQMITYKVGMSADIEVTTSIRAFHLKLENESTAKRMIDEISLAIWGTKIFTANK